MILDSNAIIRNKNGKLSARLAFEDGLLILDIDGYRLENIPSLSQHWEISEQSLKDSGNKLHFDLTGVDQYEITNFEVEFRLSPLIIADKSSEKIELTFLIKYLGLNQQINLLSADKRIEIAEHSDLEKIFLQLTGILSETNSHLKCCFGCALSGYEKGGVSLFCMKKSRDLFLSKPYIEQYQRHFSGLEREVVAEYYSCDQFEIDKEGTKA